MPLSVKRLAPLRVLLGNEDVTQYVDDGMTFSSVDPGGFEACSLQFPRDLSNAIRGQNIRIEAGLKVAWEGRVKQIQRALGHRTTINGEGYGALFKDQAVSMVFVDRDLTRWTGPSNPRQTSLVSSNFQLGTTQVSADPTNNNPALDQQITDSWVSPFKPAVESWYDSGPNNLIAAVYYDYIAGTNSQDGGVNWQDFVHLSSDANATTIETSANLNSASEQTGYFAPNLPYRFAFISYLYNATPAGSQGAQYDSYWHNLAVYGNHGLGGRGTDPVGFYPSDIFGWVVAQAAGLQAGIVVPTDASGYIVPHSVYYTPVTLDQIIGDMATIQGWHWGVWESFTALTGTATPRVDFRPRPAAGDFTAFCYRQACDTLDIREDLSQQYNQAVVNFTQTGSTPGSVTVTADNPVLDQAGIASRTVIFQGGTMTPATAQLFGQEALTILNQQGRVAGTADVISALDMPGPTPAFLLRPGIDRLRIGDAPSTDAFGAMSDYPITRVEATVSSSGITTSVEIGSGANLVETQQARLAAATALAGQGGT